MSRPSRLFVGYRALGFTSNEIPLCVRYNQRHRENYVITCVGRAFHIYNCSRLGIVNVSNRLKEPIKCMAVDDSFVFVSCCNEIHAFVRGKQIEFTYRGHVADVQLLLPFARHLISVDTTSCVKIWEIRTTEEQGQIQFNKATFEISALVHPLGIKNTVLFGSLQGSLQLWNINTSKMLYAFSGWASSVTALEQSPEERVIAIGLADGCIVVHNIVYDQTIMTFKQDWGLVTAISFRQDGEHIMCTGSQLGHIAFWDLDKRKLHSQLLSAHGAAVTGLKCLPAEPLLVTSSVDNSVKIWIFDQPDGGARLLRHRSGHSEPPIKVRFHGSDGQMLLSAGEDSTLQCFSTVHDSFNKSLGRASYNKKKTKKSGLLLDEYRMPPIVDFASETSRQCDWDGIIACHRSEQTATTWNFVRSTMGAHRIRHQRFKQDPKRHRHTTASCVDVSSCGNYCVIGYSSGHVDLYNIQSGLHRGTYGKEKAHEGEVLGVNIDGLNQQTVTCGSDAIVRFWSFKTCRLLTSIEMDAIIARSVMHRESTMLALALDDFHIVIVDIDTHRVVRLFTGHTNVITDMVELETWYQGVRNVKVLKSEIFPLGTEMAFSSDGRWLISSSMDATVKTWDLPSGKLVDCFLVESPVRSLSMSPTGLFLSTAHVGDVGIYLWSNMTLFGSAVLTPLPADYEPAVLELPSTSHKSQGERKEDVEDIELSTSDFDEIVEQISPDLVTFSQLPQSRWKNLLNLDTIRQRNKPKEPPRKPKSAPFFLPTVAGLEPKFEIPNDETSTAESKVNSNSRIMSSATRLLSEFGQLVDKLQTEHNYDAMLSRMKSMTPASIELELSLLAPVGDATISSANTDVALMTSFIDFLLYMFDSKRDIDLAVSYAGLFIKLHGEYLWSNDTLRPMLQGLESRQDAACNNLEKQMNKIICLTEFLRGATL